MSIEEIIKEFRKSYHRLDDLKYKYDPFLNFLESNKIEKYNLTTGLEMLPIELAEKYGFKMLWEKEKNQIFADPKYDIFEHEWQRHLLAYWKDKLTLIDTYLSACPTSKNVFEVNRCLFDMMIKIERRSILLNCDPIVVTQKYTRKNSIIKEYNVIRSYWVDEFGERKRSISRQIGDKINPVDYIKELMMMFHLRGYAVHQDFINDDKVEYDIIIERGNAKIAVKLGRYNEYYYNHIFLFNELSEVFYKEYPDEKIVI